MNKFYLTLLGIFFILSCGESKIANPTTNENQHIVQDSNQNKVDTIKETGDKSTVIIDSIAINKQLKEDIQSYVATLLTDLKKQDISIVNSKYIHPNYGVTIIYQPGAGDATEWSQNITIDTNSINSMYTFLFERSLEIKKNKLIWLDNPLIFSCETEEFNKKGFFFKQLGKGDKTREGIMKSLALLNDTEYSQEELAKAEFEDKNTIRIMYTNTQFDIYLNKIENKWYITYLNFTNYCDA